MGLALLLGTAALFAAILIAVATVFMAKAEGDWQTSVRQEAIRSAAQLDDVRDVYQSEAPLAFEAAKDLALSNALHEVAATTSGQVSSELQVEARVRLQTAVEELTLSHFRNARYLPNGQVDVGRRLADVRNKHPALVAIDPEATFAAGDRQSRRATLVFGSTIPISLAFLLAAAGQAIPRRRRGFVRAGFVVAIVGAAFGLVAAFGGL